MTQQTAQPVHSKVTVLMVPPLASESMRAMQVTPDHETFCAMVGDTNTDTLFAADGTAMAKVAAHAKSQNAQGVNSRATAVMEHLLPGFAKRDSLHGPAVFVGCTEDGDYNDVPTEVVEFAIRLFAAEGQDSLA